MRYGFPLLYFFFIFALHTTLATLFGGYMYYTLAHTLCDGRRRRVFSSLLIIFSALGWRGPTGIYWMQNVILLFSTILSNYEHGHIAEGARAIARMDDWSGRKAKKRRRKETEAEEERANRSNN